MTAQTAQTEPAILPTAGPLSAVHHGRGLTKYYYNNQIIATLRRGDSQSHYDPIIWILYDRIRLSKPTRSHQPHPWLEAHLVWMAIDRSYPPATSPAAGSPDRA